MKNLILLLIILTLCSDISLAGNREKAFLDSAQTLLYQNPKEGIELLKSGTARFSNLPDSTVGYIDGLVGIGYAMLGDLKTARFQLKRGLTKLPPGERRIYALKNLASVCRMQKDFDVADSIFSNTLKTLPNTPSTVKARTMIMGEYATVFIDKGQNRLAIQLLKEGLELCQKSVPIDTMTLFILRGKLANIFFDMEDYSLAANEYERNIPLIDTVNDLYNYLITKSLLSYALLNNNEPKRAFPCMESALKLAQKLKNTGEEGFVLVLYGKYSAMLDQPEKATNYFTSAFEKLKANGSQYLNICATEYLEFLVRFKLYDKGIVIIRDKELLEYQRSVSATDLLRYKRAALQILKHTASAEETLQYYHDLLPLMDSVNQIRMDRALIDTKSEFRIQSEVQLKKSLEQDNKILSQQNQTRSAQLVSVILALVALLFLIVIIVFRHRNKSLEQKRQLDQTHQIVTLKSQQLEFEAKLRALREKVIQQQKSDLLSSAEEIEKLKSNLGRASKEFTDQLTNSNTKVGLEDFLQQFSSIYPDFFSNHSRAYPLLSTSDLQFCALVRLNLSIKDISKILGIEAKSAYKKKYRIEDKMGLEQGMNLERILFQLYG
jgi:DNA-binding CsgD family transcriptional regulator